MLVLRRAGGHMQSPQSQRMGANPGATQDSGQLLVGLGEARVLAFQPWGGWAPLGCHLLLSRQAETDGSSGATLDEGPVQADSAMVTELGPGVGWVSAVFSHLSPTWQHIQQAWVLCATLRPHGVED